MKIKKGDNVIVIAGKHKGATGKVALTLPERNRVIVEGVNKIKHHIKPKNSGEKGSTIEREAAFHASNIMLVDSSTKKPTRIGSKMVGDKKVRIAKKSNSEIK